MSRNWIIALGTLSWTAVAVDLFGHTVSGDWMAAVVAGMGLATWVVDATDSTFEVEAKAAPAVIVDLWAPWCGPCRFVSPILEQLAREYAGRLKVVKVNVDENPRLAARFDAQSIPTMIVLRDGRP